MSRAGEGKNESSAGRRVIVAKGSGGQGRAERHDATGGGYWRVAIGWSLSRQHVGHAKQPSSAQSATESGGEAGTVLLCEYKGEWPGSSHWRGRSGGGSCDATRTAAARHTGCRLGVDSNVCTAESRDSLDLVREWASVPGRGLAWAQAWALGRWRRQNNQCKVLDAGGEASSWTGAGNEGAGKIVSCQVVVRERGRGRRAGRGNRDGMCKSSL